MAKMKDVAPILVSIAALGFSVYSRNKSEQLSQQQSQEQAYQGALAGAENVDFISEVYSGPNEVVGFTISNYSHLPLVWIYVRWPGGQVYEYDELQSCQQIYLKTPASQIGDNEAVDKYIDSSTLFYKTPDGYIWSEVADTTPQHAAFLPV